ncbi:MAG: hypothetical protein CMC90_02405 [Flavobacteriaceae bacterium]|nr:hypothetical protein [Flavobacteriaceae bacterium]|tara:strand:- start:1202 stop:1876 length:675 start_codon:yes stop_codon:yes gene_type:complete
MFIIKESNRFFTLLIFIQLSNFCFSQSNELKGWSSVEYGFEVNEILKIDLSQHFRLKENLNVIDTYITESEISYEPINNLTLLGQLRYYSRNDNNGGIQGFENMMRYRFGIEKKFNSNKLNFELRFAYQNRFSLDRKDRYNKRIRLRPLIELKMIDWSNNPKIYFEYFDEIDGNDQKSYRYAISQKIYITNSQDITLRYFYQKYKEKYSPNSSANIISVKYSFD